MSIKEVTKHDNTVSDACCSVCYEPFEETTATSTWTLRCNHKFHGDCLVMTLIKQSNHCPLCRHEIVNPECSSAVAFARACTQPGYPEDDRGAWDINYLPWSQYIILRRCQGRISSGIRCGNPQRANSQFCYRHRRWSEN